MPTAYYPTTPSGFAAILLSPQAWAGVGLEAASLGPVWLAVRARGRFRLLLAAASVAGFTATAVLYN
jgi:hypothetical protein